MFNRNDNVYESDNGGLISGVIKTAVAGAGLYVGTKLILDKDAFKGAYTKIYNSVTEEYRPELTAYEKQLESMRSVGSSVGKKRNLYQESRRTLANKIRENNVAAKSTFTPKISGLRESGSLAGIKINNFNDIKNLAGESIGKGIQESLTKAGYDISKATFNGTQITVPSSIGRDTLSLPFTAQDATGHGVTRIGQANKASMTHLQLNPETGKANLINTNELIQQVLSDERKALALVENHTSAAEIIKELHRNPKAALKVAMTRSDLSSAMHDLDKQKVLKKAMEIIRDQSSTWVAPTNAMALEHQSNLVALDMAHMHLLEAQGPASMRGYATSQFGRAPMFGGGNTPILGKNIAKRYSDVLNLSSNNITISGKDINNIRQGKNTSQETSRIVNAIKSGGITAAVSAGQVPDNVFYLGGQTVGPQVTEGFKTLSMFGYHRSPYTMQENAVNNWRYGTRYSGANVSSSRRISNLTSNINGGYSGRMYIDSNSTDMISINKKYASILNVEAPISVGFEGLNDSILDQEIRIVPINRNASLSRTEMLAERNKKSMKFKYRDILDSDTAEFQEIHKLMSTGNYRIDGFRRGMNLGIRTDARPITGVDDPLGMDVIDGYARLKGKSYMGHEEWSYWTDQVMNHVEGTKYSLPLKMVSRTTKGGLAHTNIRASLYYENLANVNKELLDQVSLGARNTDNILGFISKDLFKGVIPTANDLTHVSGKQSKDMMVMLHDLMFGHISELGDRGINLKLEGKAAKAFSELTGNKAHASGVDLYDFMKSGGQFNISHEEALYKKQLGISLDLTGAIRKEFEHIYQQGNVSTNAINTIKNGMEYLDASWQRLGTGDSSVRGTMVDNIWPIQPYITPLENYELSQGANRFNAARFSMRDQFMFMGDKQGILKELLTRNSVDSVQYMKEAELLRSSVGGAYLQEQMVAKAKDYANYLKNTYGQHAADEYMSVYNASLTGDVDAVKREMERFANTGNMSLNEARAASGVNILQGSFLSENQNKFGRFIPTEGNGWMHMSSAGAMGGITILPDGRVTFEGKIGGNANTMWDLMNNATTHGYIQKDVLFNAMPNILEAANFVEKERSQIKVEEALYSRVIHNTRITDSPAMMKLAEMSMHTEEMGRMKSVLGNVATVSLDDYRALIEEELKTRTGLEGSSRLVSEHINQLKGSWIYADHKVIVDQGARGLTLNDVAKKIASKQYGRSMLLERKMSGLNKAIESGDQNKIYQALKDASKFIKKYGHAGIAQRNPVIYQGSVSGVMTFINTGTGNLSRNSKTGAVSLNAVKEGEGIKNVSLGFETLLNLKGDWDGDKIQFVMGWMNETRGSVINSIEGIQRSTANWMRSLTERSKLGLKGRQTFNLAGDTMEAFVKSIYGSSTSSMLAAYMTKAATGSINVLALAQKHMIENKYLKHAKLSTEQLNEMFSYLRSMPSFISEQQVISSKHLQTLLKGTEASGTSVEKILNVLGNATPDDFRTILKETNGSFHPLMRTTLMKNAQKLRGTKEWSDIYELEEVDLNIKTGWARLGRSDFEKFKEYIGNDMSDSEFNNVIDKFMDIQKRNGVFNETAGAKAVGFDKIKGTDLLAEGFNVQSSNPQKIMKELLDNLQKQHGKEFDKIDPEHIMSEYSRIMDQIYNVSGMAYGSEAANGLPKVTRSLKYRKEIMEKITPAIDWIKEAPARRLGGIGLAAFAGLAAFNLVFGDNTPTSVNDIPSVSHNPLMDAQGGTYGYGHDIGGQFNSNTSVSLLSSRNQSFNSPNIVGSISGFLGTNPHSVSIRSDQTSPYLEKMSHYN